ncbi:8-oxo-dGTP pyrophosphatase MutT (NUDIX family) [Prosthecobacter fusiformis]|uniref:GDP-mannose pyrophosphatase n=1 Tax=Prosthecobacter fusiformis TaxID=48464 RepID=A0A4R7RUK5_9BACT|nr:NUDIX hydrolase [Prosthecobacter fusiformis]TDU69380.1 8-oxo-dGTP pyrophosphatase MutT (NUDIX family) [Prosthecobacter fusiformis]
MAPPIVSPSPIESTNPWTTLSTREGYSNPWIRVREDQVINPGGGRGIYGVVEYKNRAVGVVPIDDNGYTWLVGQWRYCHERYEWEIPEGGCPPGEEPAECARRELLEEAGIHAAIIEPLLLGVQLSNSTTNEVCDIFVARGLTFGDATPEETEQLEVKRIPLTEAIQMAQDGRIRDSVSILALLKLALKS